MHKKESKFKLKPGINTKIKKKMRIRDSILRKLKRNRSENNLKLYRKFRNRVTVEIKTSKIHYLHNYFSTNSQNMKKLWQGIKSIISNNSTTTAIRGVKDTNGIMATNSTEIANTLNKSFVNVAENISKKIPRTPKSPLNYLNGRNTNSMFHFPVTHIEVEDAISNLDSSKSCGLNSVPIYILKVLVPYISNTLATLINQSFSKGIFPSSLKTAKVIALFKKGDPEMTSNYRPISLLSSFSKLYEMLMYKRLYSFITHNELIHPLQFGVQKNNSIDHTLIRMTEAIRNTLDNKKYGCCIFIDLQKAFDTVNHGILINKLEHYGVRGNALAWFKSYLSERYQYVAVEDTHSELLRVICGVPQGSILGPLLFLLFINDLPKVSKKWKFYLFADDTNIYCESDTVDNVGKRANSELRKVKKWLDANKLSININKTNYIIFHSPKRPIPPHTSIKIGKKHITRVKYVKFLGLLLDDTLSWKYHLSELSKKLARICGFLYKIRHSLSTETLICLYNSLFMSFLQYGITVWGQTCALYIDPIIKLQKKAVRIISHQSLLCHTTPILKTLKLLKLPDIFKLRLLTFVFKSLNKLAPHSFHSYFSLNSSIHSYETRHSTRGDIYVEKKNTLQFGLRSIRYLGQNFGMICHWKLGTLPLSFYSKES